MQTGAMLTLYRNRTGLTQHQSATALGCTQANLSKWERDGIPPRQRERVLAKIMPVLESENERSVIGSVHATGKHICYLGADFRIKAISESSARYHGTPARDLLGKSMIKLNQIPELEPFIEELWNRGVFRGGILQAFADGLRVDPDRSGVPSGKMVCRVIPVGIEVEGSRGILCSFIPSFLKPNQVTMEFQEPF